MWGLRIAAVFTLGVIAGAATGSASQNDGGVVRQLTHTHAESTNTELAIDDAGNEIFASLADDIFGQNEKRNWQLVRIPANGTEGAPVLELDRGTSPDASRCLVSVSDDGQWIAFVSRSDPLGTNHDRNEELFVVARDGSGLTQLTNDPGPSGGRVSSLRIAGGGARIVFVSNSDLLGTNPQHQTQLFVVSRDGTDLRQLLPEGEGIVGFPSISDDGEKIAFVYLGDPLGTNADGSQEIFGINADGTGIRQITNATSGYSTGPEISGDGSRVTFHSNSNLEGLNPMGIDEIWIADWDASGLTRLTESTNPYGFPAQSFWPSITDDASWIYFTSSQGTQTQNPDGGLEIWKIRGNGTSLTMLTNQGAGDGSCALPKVSGSGNRVAFVFYGERLTAVKENPDEGYEIVSMKADGSEKRVLTDIIRGDLRGPDVSADGETIIFPKHLGQVSPIEYRSTEIFRMGRDGGEPVQITDENAAWSPSVTLDGSKIVYVASDGLYTIRTDGTERTQLIEFGIQSNPVIAGDGSLIVFDSTDDKTGANPDGSRELFSILPDGSGLTQLTDGPTGTVSEYGRLDAAGTWLVFRSNANHTGENSDGTGEAFLMRSDGSDIQQLSHMPPGGSAGGG